MTNPRTARLSRIGTYIACVIGEKGELEVSACTAADLDAVEALWPRRGCDARYARQQAGESAFLLARSDGRLVGRAEVIWLGPKMPDVADVHPDVPEINGLDVVPELRRHGIGSAIVGAAERLARSRGCRAIGLGVGEDNPEAGRLYRRLGYSGDLPYLDTYVWVDQEGAAHNGADRCRFLTKLLL